MKKVLIITVLCLLFFSQTALAHPPAKIDAEYDGNSKVLKAVIVHPVANSENHFIKKVDVAINGTEVISQAIGAQDDNNSQQVLYRVPDVKAGDVLSVEAYCSKSGKKTVKITVE